MTPDPRDITVANVPDPNNITLGPPPARSPLAEIGTGALRGAVVGLPTLAGQALQYASSPGSTIYNIGKGWADSAEERGNKPSMQLQPGGHGMVTNALASGAEMLAPGLAVPLAIGAGAAAAGASPLIAGGAAIAGAGALFGAQQGQATLDKAEKAHVDPQMAHEAARLNAATTFATQTALGAVGGSLLGVFGKTMGTMFTKEAGPLAEQTMKALTGTGGVVTPLLKALPVAAGEGVALNMGQAAATAVNENSYGIDNASPWEVAKEQIGPTLGMTALLTPLGLVARAAQVRSAQARTATLAHSDTSPEIRTQLANEYAAELAKSDPAAAANFRVNASLAIEHKMVMDVDAKLLMPGAVNAPPEITTTLGAAPPTAPRTFPEVRVPDLTTTLGAAAPRDGIDFTRETRDVDTTSIEAAELHTQVKQALTEAGVAPAAPLTRKDFASSDAAKGLKGQAVAKAYAEYLADPATREGLMRKDADAYDTLQNQPAPGADVANAPARDVTLPSEPMPGRTAMAEAMTAAIKNRDTAQAFAGRDATKAAQLDAIQNITRGEQLAQAAERGELLPDANAPKRVEDLVADWGTAMAANSMDTKAQARVPFEKKLAALGVGEMKTHQEQIDALKGVVADKKVSQGMKDRVSMLVNQLEAEMPPKPVEPIKVEVTEAVAVKPDAVAAAEAAPAASPRQQVLDGLVQPGLTRQEVLEGLRGRAAEEAKALVANPDDAGIAALQAKLDHYNAVESQAKALDAADANPLKGEAPPQVEALGKNIPEGKPSTRGQPPEAAAVTETLEPNIPRVSVSELAETASDRAMALRVEFNDRVRAGEKLTPLEEERREDLSNYAKTLARYTEGKATPADEGFVRSMAAFVDEASKPYKQSLRSEVPAGTVMSDPFTSNMGLLAPAAKSGKATDVAAHLEQHGSTPATKELAEKLKPLLGDVTIAPGPDPTVTGVGQVRRFQDPADTTMTEASGRFAKGHIDIWPRGANEQVILHEMVHAVTSSALDYAATIGRPKNQRDAVMKKAYAELEEIRFIAERSWKASDTPTGALHYGLSNAHEFVAELHANRDFQQFLQDTGGVKPLWMRAVNAVLKLVGRPPADAQLFERAMRASEAFFTPDQMAREFDAHPAGAARMVGESLLRAVDRADTDRTPFTKMTDAAFTHSLPWKTVEYIAHQVRGVPEFVASGLSRGVDAFDRANAAHQVAIEHLRTPGARFVGDVSRVQRAAGDKAPALNTEMAYIAMEASRVGFDYRKNFKDNALVDNTLDPKDKPYIDEIHRRFTQMQRTNPEAAALIERGERRNRALLIDTVATIAASAMDARAGYARRLAADLERLPPGDAQRAVLESQVKAITLESTFAAQHSKGLDFQDPSLRTAKNADPVRFDSGASSTLGQRLEAAFKAAATLPEGTPLREHMAALAGHYNAQLKNPYFSLGREGDYFVKVDFKGVDAAANARIQEALKGTNKVVGDLTRGDDHAYFRVDGPDQAQALGARLVLAGQGKVINSAWGKQAEKVNDALGAAPALRSLLASLDDAVGSTPGLKADQAAIMKETITRQVLSMLPETSSRSASMGRRGVPGYDADFLGSFARRANAGVHDVAGLYTNRAFAEAARMRAEAVEQMNRTGSAQGRVRAQEIDTEINKRFANNMKPTSDLNTAVGQATSLAHSFYLGVSPANLIRTFAQPWMLGLPIIGSKFGHMNAMGELLGAQATALKLVTNSVSAAVSKDGVRGMLGAPIELQGLGVSAKDQGFINEMHLRGVLELGEGAQLMRAGETGNQRVQGVVRAVGTITQMAEMANRAALGLAAFRLAEKRPGLLGKGETSTEYALRVTNQGMHNFDPSNTARAMGKHGVAGPLTPLFAQFQQFTAQAIQQITRTVHDGFFGQDKSPEGLRQAKEAKHELAGLMATTGMAAGALGLPFANLFAGAYNMLMSDPDDPKDVRIAIRNWAANTFGKDAAGVLMHGPGHALGVDTSSFGMQGLFPGSDFLASRALWKDRADAQVRSMMGPAISLGVDMSTAVSKMADGYWLKGIEAALPIGLRTYFKTAEMAGVVGPGGYTDSKGNPISVGGRAPGEVGASDIAWRALGFQTADKADQGEAARDFISNQKLLQHRRGIITDQFVKGVQNPSGLADAGQALRAFNAKNPTQAITNQEIAGAIRAHVVGNALGMASGTGVTVTKRQFPTLVENERFAAMPR